MADRSTGIFAISVAAEMLSMQVQNLRVYERHGLVDPDRTPGGTRLYSPEDLDKLARVRDLLVEGLNLAGISRVVALEAEAQEGRPMTDETDRVQRIAELATERGFRLVAAESLTSGTLATLLGAGPDAAEWFGGGIVAYQEPVKFDVLGVDEGPVVTGRCAGQMAQGVRRLFGADLAVSCTGVGGPEPNEGKPAGTVFVAVATKDDVVVRGHQLDGSPEEVLDQTAASCLALVEEMLRKR
jgi:nicotinamide-nucleotide amidase